MYRKVTILTLATATLGCSPLNKVQHERHVDVVIADSTLTRLVRSELERTMTTLNQTVVEFYPPQPEQPKESSKEKEQKAVATPPPAPRPRGAVKRIVKTEVVNGTESKSTTDSLSHSRINTAARCDEQSSLEETPNTSGSSWLKWGAGCLALLLLIIIVLKF